MKKNNTDLDQYKKIQGQRLTEVMKLRHKTRTEVRKILKENYAFPIERQSFYKYENGINWMPEDFINCVSEILDVDSGYLSGKDNYSCEEYFDYEFELFNKGYSLYEKVLKQFGYSLMKVGLGWNELIHDISFIYVIRESDNLQKKFTPEEFTDFLKKCIDEGFEKSDPVVHDEISDEDIAKDKRKKSNQTASSKSSEKRSDKGSSRDDSKKIK